MKRALSLDVLRGLSIFGMVLAATIPFGGALPAWMYHAQCPPPTHAFNPQVAGITWVDLVLPVFIFCMGAAIPLALNRKIEKGANGIVLGKSIVARFFSLVFFAIYIAHIYGIGNRMHCSTAFVLVCGVGGNTAVAAGIYLINNNRFGSDGY